MSMSRINILPMFVFILILYGGLISMIFLLQFFICVNIDVNSIFSLKPLILKALSCAGEALWKY